MNNLQRIVCALAVGMAQSVLAHQVNECVDAGGRKVMTDRPCENPATERKREQDRKVRGVGAEQVQAVDIFSTRTKLRNNGKPVSAKPSQGESRPQP